MKCVTGGCAWDQNNQLMQRESINLLKNFIPESQTHIAAIHASFKNILTYFDRLEQVLSYIVGSIIS